ncbi:MAG: hypothetical protein GF375_01045 [Candidatus Omnitrophica bacterium]|nr:hypothetical protein [Candidatus Omnitrophota bacterium]
MIVVILILYRLIAHKRFSQAINRFLEKNIVARGILRQKALEELFHLPKGYGVAQLTISGSSKEKGLTLAEAGFNKKNILILSIERGDKLISFPHADDIIEEGDKLLCYGLIKNIKLYVKRPAGEAKKYFN